MKHTALHQIARIAIKPSFIFLTLFFMLAYLLLQAYILNHSLINQTVSGAFSLSYKTTLLYYVGTGYLSSLPLQYLSVTLFTTLLVGLNLSLAVLTYQKARAMGEMKLTLGGSSLLAVVSSGCPSCGLTALSLLGPSTGAISFFLHDVRIQILIVGILLFSIVYNFRKLLKAPICSVADK